MQPVLILIVLIAGTFNAIEAGTNTVLRKGIGAPFFALAIISASTLALALIGAVVMRERLPSVGEIAILPWWAWLGGILGFGFVTAMIYTAEDLGSALFIGLTVTASTILSVLLDHLGLLGFARHHAGLGRILGAALMVLGVTLIAVF